MDAMLKYQRFLEFVLQFVLQIRQKRQRQDNFRIGHIPKEKLFFISNNQLIPRGAFHPQKHQNKLEAVGQLAVYKLTSSSLHQFMIIV